MYVHYRLLPCCYWGVHTFTPTPSVWHVREKENNSVIFTSQEYYRQFLFIYGTNAEVWRNVEFWPEWSLSLFGSWVFFENIEKAYRLKVSLGTPGNCVGGPFGRPRINQKIDELKASSNFQGNFFSFQKMNELILHPSVCRGKIMLR